MKIQLMPHSWLPTIQLRSLRRLLGIGLCALMTTSAQAQTETSALQPTDNEIKTTSAQPQPEVAGRTPTEIEIKNTAQANSAQADTAQAPAVQESTKPESVKPESGDREPAKEPFDLKQTIQYAISNSPAFDSPKRELEIATLEEKTAFARQLPSLDLTAIHGPQEDSVPGVLASRTKSELNLGLTENLYDNGIARTNHKIAQLRKSQAELIYNNQKNKLSLTVTSAYIRYSLAIKLVEIQEKQFHLIRRQSELISKNYYEGLRTKKDFLRFKTQVSRGEINLLNARNNIQTTKEELIRLISAGVSKTPIFEFEPLNFDRVDTDIPDTEINIEKHFEYAASRLQKQINGLSADLTRRKYWPEWFVTAGATYSSADYINTGRDFNDNDRWGWNALLTVRYNFLDWGIRKRDREVAQLRNTVLDNVIETQMLTLQSELRQLRTNINQIEKNYLLSKELLALESSNIQLIEREYRNGQVQYLDLITGLQDLSDSQVRFFNATADLQTARYTLLFHQGSLYESLTK